MDRKTQLPAGESAKVFTEAEYKANAGGVIAHAAASGRAVVASADGQPRVVISILTRDLPTFESID